MGISKNLRRFILFALVYQSAQANSMPQPTDTSPYAPRTSVLSKVYAHVDDHRFAVYFVTGGTAASLTNNKNVTITSGAQNVYTTNSGTIWGGLFGLGVGFITNPLNYVSVTIDPAFYITSTNTVTGTEIQNLTNNLFSYSFDVSTFALMLESHILFTTFRWQPSIVVGVGGAFNSLENYNESPISSGATPASQVFTKNTTTSLAVEAGLGVQRLLYSDKKRNVDYSLGLDYRYYNFGLGQLGQSGVQVGTSDHLQVNSIAMNTVLLSLNLAMG